MIYREYSTEYNDLTKRIRHNIKISTDNHHVFHTIKQYAESVCEGEDYPAFCEDASERREE